MTFRRYDPDENMVELREAAPVDEDPPAERDPTMARDGYTRIARRPHGADPGDVMSEADADAYERYDREFNRLGRFGRRIF